MVEVPREQFSQFLDIEDAMRRLGGNKAIFEVLLKKFLANDLAAELMDTLARGDITENAVSCAHTIKGLAANLSMPKLNESAAALEMALRKNEPAGDMPQQVSEAWNKTVFVVNKTLGV